MATKRPERRIPRADIVNPSFEDLLDLALVRVCDVVQSRIEDPPPRLFPLAESMRWDFFSFDDWNEFGDLEIEHGRLAYTLTRYPERGPPAACEAVLQDLLRQSSVLGHWPTILPVLRTLAKAALEDVSRRQLNGSSGHCTKKADCHTVPIDCEVGKSASNISLQLWKRSLSEIATQLAKGRSAGEEEFLQIHAYLKDPIYGFAKPFKTQQLTFKRLLTTFQESVSVEALSLQKLERVAAQAAQESSYLSSPLLDRITLIHFHAHHQLPYANILLDSLARAEFSVPTHVLEVAEEMFLAAAANDGAACPLVPILVTSRPSFSNPGHTLTPILDGNHRATASLLLRFLAKEALLTDHAITSHRLLEYCTTHHLGKKWQIDLLDVLDELCRPHSSHFRNQLLVNRPLLRKFASVKYIPALVVQEEDFHTICKQRSVGKAKPVLLQPFHQTLFNDDELPFALPQKAGQTHGRPEAFRLMPLTPFGTAQEEENVHEPRVFKVELRQSMNGLPQEGMAVARNKHDGAALAKLPAVNHRLEETAPLQMDSNVEDSNNRAELAHSILSSKIMSLNARRTSEEKKIEQTSTNETSIPRSADNDSTPTNDDLKHLPRVSDNIPYTIFMVVAAELSERFAYRSITGPMRKSKLRAHFFYPNQ